MQTKQVEKELLKKAEIVYGLDDRLVNGLVYKDKHPKATKHPYFLNDSWKKGVIFINDNVYKNLSLNYNIESEQIILNQFFSDRKSVKILLNNNVIDSVLLTDRLFINSKHIKAKEFEGFYELVYRGNFTAYRKHTKGFHERHTTFDPHGTYSNTESVLYLINKKGEGKKIKGKGSLLNSFSKYKRQIKKYIKKNQIIFNKISKNQLINLLQYCDGISSN